MKFLVACRDGWCFSTAQVLGVSLSGLVGFLATDQLAGVRCDCSAVTPFFLFAEARDFLARVPRDLCYHVVTRRTSTRSSTATRTERREVNTAFPPREPRGGARPQSTSRVTEGRLVPPRAGTLSGPLAKLCRARLVAGVCAWKQFRFHVHLVQKDLCNAARLRKRRELGEARFESDELENAVGRKRLLEQHCSRVGGAENFPRRPEFCVTYVREPLAVRTISLRCEGFRGSAGPAEILLFKRHQLSSFQFAGTIVGVESCGLCSNFDFRDRQICLVPQASWAKPGQAGQAGPSRASQAKAKPGQARPTGHGLTDA